MALTLYSWDELPTQKLMDGLFERTALRSNGSLVTFNWIQPGAPRPEPHSHPFDQLSLVVTGTLLFWVGGEEITAGPGTALLIPPDVLHTAVPIGSQRVLNIDVFAPAREDYLFLVANEAVHPGTEMGEVTGFGASAQNDKA